MHSNFNDNHNMVVCPEEPLPTLRIAAGGPHASFMLLIVADTRFVVGSLSHVLLPQRRPWSVPWQEEVGDQVQRLRGTVT